MPRAARPLLLIAALLLVSGLGVAVSRIADDRGEVAVDDPTADSEDAPGDPAGDGTEPDEPTDPDDPVDPDAPTDPDDPVDPAEPDADEPDAAQPDAAQPDDETVAGPDGGEPGPDDAPSGEVAAGIPGSGELPDTGPSGAATALGAAALALATTRRRRGA